MDKFNCKRCNKTFSKNEVVLTDEFGFLDEPVAYCHPCFLELVKQGDGNFDPGTCEKCGTKLEAQFEDIEDIIDEGLVNYDCPVGIKNDEDGHDSMGLYLVQPGDGEKGWAGFDVDY